MSNSDKGLLSHIRFRPATALVIANVIRAGVFTTTGFQAADRRNCLDHVLGISGAIG